MPLMHQAELLEQWRTELSGLQSNSDIAQSDLDSLEEVLRVCVDSLSEPSDTQVKREPPQAWQELVHEGCVVTDPWSRIRHANGEFRSLLNVGPILRLRSMPFLCFIAKEEQPRFIRECLWLRQDSSFPSDLHIRLEPIGRPPFEAPVMGRGVYDSDNKLLSIVWVLQSQAGDILGHN